MVSLEVGLRVNPFERDIARGMPKAFLVKEAPELVKAFLLCLMVWQLDIHGIQMKVPASDETLRWEMSA